MNLTIIFKNEDDLINVAIMTRKIAFRGIIKDWTFYMLKKPDATSVISFPLMMSSIAHLSRLFHVTSHVNFSFIIHYT